MVPFKSQAAMFHVFLCIQSNKNHVTGTINILIEINFVYYASVFLVHFSVIVIMYMTRFPAQ